MKTIDVKKFLESKNYGDRFTQFEQSTATVGEAAKALNCDEDQIAKSITLYNENGDGAYLIVASGNSKIDNRSFKDTFGIKAKMLTYEDVERFVGHKVGGVCPFEVLSTTKIYLDTSLKKHQVVYPAAGDSNSTVKLTLEELTNLCDFVDWISVTK
ncbi:YbaK/EbsC family protein [Myroides injenensis]|uniref:YbaK/EbsC family protein n=1 Tax=Myroides injenensis TaxID=1183151 RepID=UPI000289D3A6|nr:YbaK/EbsC family protein [Myroides injenensis]